MAKQNAKQLEMIKTADLIPYARNARTHSDQQVAQIAGSIQEFGFCNPVLIDQSNGIIAGHGRVLAAQKLKLETVPCLRLSHLTDAQKRAYVLADNRIALSSGWDEAMLANELSDLHADDFDMALLGFDTDELENLLKLNPSEQQPAGEIIEDEVPEPPADPITKSGDLWLLGDHRLLCGDSTKAWDVERLMAGAKAGMMVTDPPYNVEYEGNYIQSGRILKKEQKVWSGGIANDNLSNFGEWLASVFAASDAAIGIGAAIYVWHPPGEDGKYFWSAWPYDRWHFQVDLVWNKTSLIISRWDYKPQHEPCMYGWKGKNRSWIGPNNEPTVWDIPRQQGASGEKREHPTQKPVECMARAIRNHDGSVYDPFLGSGTTLIAAEKLGRKCYGMEISPAYCDVIVKRWETLTGKKAELENKQCPAKSEISE